jgi:hypothetical protein
VRAQRNLYKPLPRHAPSLPHGRRTLQGRARLPHPRTSPGACRLTRRVDGGRTAGLRPAPRPNASESTSKITRRGALLGSPRRGHPRATPARVGTASWSSHPAVPARWRPPPGLG